MTINSTHDQLLIKDNWHILTAFNFKLEVNILGLKALLAFFIA